MLLMELNPAISACARARARRHLQIAADGSVDGKKGGVLRGEGERKGEEPRRQQKMEMRFAIGPCNFCNLNLIFSL